MFKYERHNKINNDRASERKKRQINKIHSYRGGFYPHLFSKPLAHAKSPLFKPLGYPVDHVVKIEN